MRLLLVEDDEAVGNFLKKMLEGQHYSVDLARNGNDAWSMAQDCKHHLVILDVNLPGMNGLEVLKHIRSINTLLPVLMLSSKRDVEDRVQGLELGADDYLPKPFAFAELAARVRALLRRSARTGGDAILRADDLELNRVERTVIRAGKPIELTPKEFGLLEYLLLNSGRPVTRAMIIEHVWNMSLETITNVVDVYVNYLRKKIDGNSERKLIRTIRGVGYLVGSDTRSSNSEVEGGGTLQSGATGS